MGAYGSKSPGKAKPSQYPYGQTGGTEMTANKNKMSGKQEKEWSKMKARKK